MKEKKAISSFAKNIQKLAVYTALETVGKSYPWSVHEVELSDDLRTKILNRQSELKSK